jgi:hypothetical protein
MHRIDWALLDHAAAYPVRIGDLVSSDAGGMPIYRVVGLSGAEVWVGEEDGQHGVRAMPLSAFCWRGALALAA